MDFKLLLITDRQHCGGRQLLDVVDEAFTAGVKALQVREKDLDADNLFILSQKVRSSARRHNTPPLVFVNGRPDIAMMAGLQGVQMPFNAVPSLSTIGDAMLIGVSCHNLLEATRAQENGADFILFGPVYETASKNGFGKPQGTAVLAKIAEKMKIPVYAVGGVTPARVKECLDAGAHGVAVISAIMAAPSVTEAVKGFEKELGGL